MTNQFRPEVEQMLLSHKRSHFAQTFILVASGLTDEQVASKMNVSTARSARVRKAVEIVLNDQPVPSKTWASIVAAIYRELLNYAMSEELRQHARTRVAQLQKVDPTIPSSTLGHLTLGANVRPRPAKPEEPCAQCFMVHTGECL